VGGGLILETNCIFEYKPPLHFRLDVVYKMGGVLTEHYGNCKERNHFGHKVGGMGLAKLCCFFHE